MPSRTVSPPFKTKWRCMASTAVPVPSAVIGVPLKELLSHLETLFLSLVVVKHMEKNAVSVILRPYTVTPINIMIAFST